MPWSWRPTSEVGDCFQNRLQNRSLEQQGNEHRQENQADDLGRFHARNVITFRLRTGMSRLGNSKTFYRLRGCQKIAESGKLPRNIADERFSVMHADE
jgi:hypothetical protein